jgi:hypothetical protein
VRVDGNMGEVCVMYKYIHVLVMKAMVCIDCLRFPRHRQLPPRNSVKKQQITLLAPFTYPSANRSEEEEIHLVYEEL